MTSGLILAPGLDEFMAELTMAKDIAETNLTTLVGIELK